MALAGCEQIIGADFSGAKPIALDGGGGVAGAAGSGARGGSGASGGSQGGRDAAAPLCDPVRPVERRDIPPATDAVEFTVVIDTIDYGDRVDASGEPAYASIGFDLDGVCTTAASPNCAPPAWLDADLTDGARGRDNGVGKLLLSQVDFFGDALISSALLNENVALGLNAPAGILRVRAFGGLAEDDHVEVDWFVPPPASAPDAGGVPFDAVSAWAVDADTVVDPTAPSAGATVSRFRDDDAFVTQRTLVARFDMTLVPLLDVFFEVHDVVLTATTVRNTATGDWTLTNAVLSGWSENGTLLRVIPEIAFQSFAVTLCTDNAANYPTIKEFVCSGTDLSAGPPDPNAPCEATSVGAAFTTQPAALGPLVAVPRRPMLCPPPTDPGNDTCDAPPVGGDR